MCYTLNMTARTHDLAAFTALSFIVATQPIPQMTLATAIVAVGANLMGGLAPDLDEPTSEFWRKLPAGSVFGRLIAPIMGGHRFISHSPVGVFLFGVLLDYLLTISGSVLLVDMEIVWYAFMIGFISHLLMDCFTKEGIPLLFPLPLKLGIPPFKLFRIKTGGILEKAVIFPGLLILNALIFSHFYQRFFDVAQAIVR